MDAKNVVTETAEVVTTATTPVVVPEVAPVMVTPNIEEPKTNHVWGYAAGAGAVVVIGAAGFGIYKLVKHFKAKKEAKNAAVEEDQTAED